MQAPIVHKTLKQEKKKTLLQTFGDNKSNAPNKQHCTISQMHQIETRKMKNKKDLENPHTKIIYDPKE